MKSKRRHLKRITEQLRDGEIDTNKAEAAYFGWRVHAVKAKNARTQILNTDAYFRGLLNRCGYDLRIIETKKGKIHFKIVILPFEQEA